MSALVVIAVCGVVFFLLPLVLRSNAVYVLFFLCMGEVVAKLLGQDTTQLVNSFVSVQMPVLTIVQIVLLLVLPLIILFVFKGAIKGPKLIKQLLPALAAAALSILFIVAKLPYDAQRAIEADSLYKTVEPFLPFVAGVGALAAFFYIYGRRPKPVTDEKKKHHK